ncbi:MAG: hypothetical protein ACYC3A_05120 [Halothiobacillus sp.]
MRTIHLTLFGGLMLGLTAIGSPAWAETSTLLQSTHQERVQTQTRQAPTAADFERLNNQNRTRTESGMGGGNQYGAGAASGNRTGSGSSMGQQRRYGGGHGR